MKKFLDWVVFGPEETHDTDNDDDGFREATPRPTSSDEYDEAFHRSIRRRNATFPAQASRRLDASGGGLIDLQVGSRVFNDVPAKMRSELWMSKLHSLATSPSLSSPLASYEDCLGREVDPNVLQEIEKDIHRTFPGHVTLTSPAGQAAMRDVLRAYASYDPAVGYSQGMNFIVGLLLTYLTPRHAFAALLLIMSERGLREYYLPDGMVHLQARLWQLGKLIDDELAQHLESHMVLPVLYASSWVLTCFAAEFPLKFCARVLDCLITDSFELPIMKVSVSILKRCRDEILQLDDMEEIIDLLRKKVPGWPERRLMDLLTESLSSPWTAGEKAVLAEERMVESVVDAVRRIGGGGEGDKGDKSDKGDMGGRADGEGECWEPQWEPSQSEPSRSEPSQSNPQSEPQWEPEWEGGTYGHEQSLSVRESGATAGTLTSASTQRLSPFQSGMASGDLIDVHTEEGNTRTQNDGETTTPNEGAGVPPSRQPEAHRTRQLDSQALSMEGSMRHLLQSFAQMNPSGSTRAPSLEELRDIVFSSSFNYGTSGSPPQDSVTQKDDDFGEWEG